MIASAKPSVDEQSIRYQALTKLTELADGVATVRNLNNSNDKILQVTKIRLWLKALDYKNYLSREQREKIWYALIHISGIYDFPVAPVLANVSRPDILIGGGGGGAGSVNEWGDIGGTLSNQLDLQAALDAKVDISGDTMTGDLGFTGAGIDPTDYIQFNTTPTAYTPAIGNIGWNDVEGTIDLLLRGGVVNLPLGQKQVARVVNGTGGNVLKSNYQVVKVIGAQGQRLQVALAQANNDANSADTLGLIAENINNNNTGFIVTSGIVENINTTGSLQGETWVDGNPLYLSPTVAGRITNIKPQAPQHTVIVGFVVYAHANNGKIYVKVDNGYELDELHNVRITTGTLSNGQVLKYNSTLSVWENQTVSDGHTIQDAGVAETQRTNLNFQRMLVTDDAGNNATVVTRPADTYVGITAPASPVEGDVWTNSETWNTYKYYDSFWVEVSNINPSSVAGSGTTNELAYFSGTNTISSLTTGTYPSFTELSYVKGVTSAIQTQLNGKQATLTNPVTGTGTSGYVTYWTGTNSVSGSATFVYTPTSELLVNNAVTASGAIARGVNFTPSLTAAANNDVLTGLEIDTTFTTGAFTGTNSIGLSVRKGKLQVLNGWVGNTGTSDVGFFGNPLASDQFIGVDALQGSTSGIIFRSQQQERIKIFRSATNFNLQVTTAGVGSPTFTHFYSTGNTFLGQSPTDAGFRLDVNGLSSFTGTTASDGGQLGSELLSASGWTSTGWTGSFGAGWTHTTGNTTALTNTLAAVTNNYYQITYTVTGRTAGTFSIAFGGVTISGIGSTGVIGPRATSTGTLSITPTTDFDGTIVISIKVITAGSATITIKNSSGVVINELNGSNSNTNLFYGIDAGTRVTTGVSNTFAGTSTGSATTTGNDNTAFGYRALAANNTGGRNSAFGFQTLINSTTGGSHCAFGYQSLANTTTGFGNSAFGEQSGISITTGTQNAAFGYYALYNITTSTGNTALGAYAGRYIGSGTTVNQTSSNSIYLGFDTRASASGNTNEIVIGYNVVGLGSNTTILGNSSTVTTGIYGNLLLGTTTDSGFKLDVNGTARVQNNLTLGTVGAGTGLFWDNTNNRLNLGNALPTNTATHNIVASTTLVGVSVKNTSSGAGVTQCGFYVENNLGYVAQLYKTGSGYTTYKAISANDLGFYNGLGGGDISIFNDFSTGKIKLTAGGSSSFHWQIESTGQLTAGDAINIALGTTTGTKIGTATSQKIGFFNASPVVQRTTAGGASTLVGGGGTTITDTDTFDGYTLKQIVKALRDLGLLA